MITTWGTTLSSSFTDLWAGVISYIPMIIVAIIILVAGMVVASFIGKIIDRIIKSIKLDNALRSAGIEQILGKGGITLNSGAFLGGLVKWFIVIVFLVASLNVLGLNQVNDFLRETVLSYLPRVIVAAIILLVAAVIAQAMQKVVISSAKAAGVVSASLAGGVTKWAIWIFAVIAALIQLNIAPLFMNTLLTGVVVALSLAFGLSFGLGGQDAAARFIEKVRAEVADHTK